MRPCIQFLSLLLLGMAGGAALAQRPGSVAQLPTFSYFTGGTTVWVPDRGSVQLGGVRRAASGRSGFGVPMLPVRPWNNAAIGGARGASNMHVTVTVHDFAAMDEYLLSRPTPFSQSRRSARPGTAATALGAKRPLRDPARGPAFKSRSGEDFGDPPAMSVADARAVHARQQSTRVKEATDFLQLGRQAEATGKTGAAKIFYQMAARRASGELKQRVLSRLEALP